jgi:hypothetical protein
LSKKAIKMQVILKVSFDLQKYGKIRTST